MKTARLADIAQRAGVSEATVSRVLNDKPGVSTSTREAVLEAVDLLGYDRPSRLRRRTAGLVGLVVPELSNPIFPYFAQVIETELSAQGFTPVLCTQTTGGIHEDEYVAMLLDRGVAGIVFVSGQHADTKTSPERYERLRARELPMVLVNGPIPGMDIACVSNDDHTGMALAVEHLHGLGHRDIGLAAGPQRYTPVIRKVAGFKAALEVRDLATRHVSFQRFGVDGGRAAADELIDDAVTGIVCASPMIALGVIDAIHRRGLSVPRDISVVGYDDSMLLDFTNPPLTTLRQNVEDMSRTAVRALRAEIRGERGVRAEYVFRPELVVRESTAPAPPVASVGQLREDASSA